VQSGPDGPFWDVEGARDLDRIEPQVVAQDQDGALIGLQAAEAAIELVTVEDTLCLVGPDRCVDRQGPNVCIVSPGAAVVLVAVVDEESGQPGLEPIRIAEAGQLTPGDHQRVLDRVLGSFVVSQDPSRDPEQPVTAGTSQDGERIPVTALGCDDKLRIHDPR
jgi:hypothetical protein